MNVRGVLVVAVVALFGAGAAPMAAAMPAGGCPQGYVVFDRQTGDGSPPNYRQGDPAVASGVITNTNAGVTEVSLRWGAADGPELGRAAVDAGGSWKGLTFRIPAVADGAQQVYYVALDGEGRMLPGLPYPFEIRVGAPAATAGEPVAAAPAARAPATRDTSRSTPEATRAAASKPATSKPTVSKPATSKPTASKPATSKPIASKPGPTAGIKPLPAAVPARRRVPTPAATPRRSASPAPQVSAPRLRVRRAVPPSRPAAPVAAPVRKLALETPVRDAARAAAPATRAATPRIPPSAVDTPMHHGLLWVLTALLGFATAAAAFVARRRPRPAAGTPRASAGGGPPAPVPASTKAIPEPCATEAELQRMIAEERPRVVEERELVAQH